jgi:addiction module HigA family antidote
MTDKPTKGLRPTHPGEILREDVLPALDITKTRFAELLHVSRQTLYDLLGEKQPVTPRMALRLGRLLGNGPEIWLRLQGSYDLATQAEAMAGELEQIEALKAA